MNLIQRLDAVVTHQLALAELNGCERSLMLTALEVDEAVAQWKQDPIPGQASVAIFDAMADYEDFYKQCSEASAYASQTAAALPPTLIAPWWINLLFWR